jgi:hypothetical protein
VSGSWSDAVIVAGEPETAWAALPLYSVVIAIFIE